MFSGANCPLGDEKRCPGHQLRNKYGQIVNDCAFCKKSKDRILPTITVTSINNTADDFHSLLWGFYLYFILHFSNFLSYQFSLVQNM